MKIREFLKLKPLRKHKILAGENGLDKTMGDINIFEYKLDETKNRSGMLYISSFNFVGTDMGKIYEVIHTLIETKSPGLIVVEEFVNSISEEVKQLANANNFPVILIPNNIMYSSIFSAFFYENISREYYEKERILNQLYDTGADPEKCLAGINPSFKPYYVVFYIVGEFGHKILIHNSVASGFVRNSCDEVVSFKDGTIVICSNDTGIFDIDGIAEEIMYKIENNSVNDNIKYSIGVSNTTDNRYNAKKIIREAMHAQIYQKTRKENGYALIENIGRYRVVIPMVENIEVVEYVESIVILIKEYDIEQKDKLYDTFKVYKENRFDINRTSKDMFLHPNTVRYRMKKLEYLLENKVESLYELSLFVEILEML